MGWSSEPWFASMDDMPIEEVYDDAEFMAWCEATGRTPSVEGYEFWLITS